MGSRSRGQLIIILILVAVAVLFFLSRQSRDIVDEPLTEVAALVREGKVTNIQVEGNRLLVVLKDRSKIVSLKEPESALTEQLLDLGITTEQLEAVQIEVGRGFQSLKLAQ